MPYKNKTKRNEYQRKYQAQTRQKTKQELQTLREKIKQLEAEHNAKTTV